MSNELVPLEAEKYPALTGGENILAALQDNLGGEPMSPFDLQITHPGAGAKAWTLPSGETIQSIRGIVLYTTRHNVLWTGEPGAGEPPACKSRDGLEGIGIPGGKCADCAYMRPGSHPEGKSKWRRACTARRLVVVLAEGEDLPYFLSAPADSLKNLRAWLFGLTRHRPRLLYWQTITELSLVEKQKPTPHSVVQAKHVSTLDKEAEAAVGKYTSQFRPTIDLFLEAPPTEGGSEEDVAF